MWAHRGWAVVRAGLLLTVAAGVLGVSAGSAAASYRRVCSAPGPRRFECMALLRTDIKAVSERQLRARSVSPQGPVGDGYGPADLQSAYDLASAAASAGGGETVAVVDAYNDPNAASDVATYRSAWGLPACGPGCFSVVNQNGEPSPLPTNAGTTGWDVEESLDVDMVSAICPNCKVMLVEANSNSDSDLGNAVDAAVAAGADYVSNSYGGGESPEDSALDAAFYDHPGVAVTASAGDDGYGVSYPAASQYVTSVGGTSLYPASNPRGWSETAWGSSNGGEGTGSGCSQFESKPSWQTDGGCSDRMDNDVSAVADPDTGVAIYDSYSEGGWLEVGGTSASSPIIAAVYALAGIPGSGTTPASYPYADPSALNDVTSGSNGTCGEAYFCTAEIGYDGPTGLGTPNGVAAFASPLHSTSTSVSCSPSSVVVAQSTSCTATVTDTSSSPTTPSGTVGLSDTEGGSFAGTPCTLAGSGDSASCQVTYTPVSGLHTNVVMVSYAGDATHSGSHGSTGLSVGTRTTSTSLSCAQSSLSIGASTTCTATVTDTDAAGVASAPAGTVSFSGPTGSNDSFTPSSCTLSSSSSSSSSCQVSYSPTGGPKSHRITATYHGNNTDHPGNGKTLIKVTNAPKG